MHKKVIPGFIAIYVVISLTNFLIHNVMLKDIYLTLVETGLMRPETDGTMWIYFVTALVVAFFFTLIFSKGYNGTGVGEGVRYGLYAGLFVATQFAYNSYASYPLPYALALQWFIYTVIQYIILGIVVAAVFGKSKGAAA